MVIALVAPVKTIPKLFTFSIFKVETVELVL
jgi:hypothetical protein